MATFSLTPKTHSIFGPFVITETADLLVLEKPEGMSSVKLPKGGEYSVADWILEHYPTQAQIGEKPEDAGALYRLDKDTSGLLLFARTDEAFQYYRTLWKTDHVVKHYLAVVSTPLKNQTISFPVGRSEKVKGKSVAILSDSDLKKIRGTPLRAISIIEGCEKARPLKQLATELAIWKIRVRIETGAPHQIRVHCAALNSPIVGDKLYGGTEADRLYLHCRSIELPERGTEKTLEFLSPKSI